MISKKSSARTFGPPSIGFPDPLKVLPNISSEMGILSTSPVNSTYVFTTSIFCVPSKIFLNNNYYEINYT
jgi:hypothetical protein